MGICQALFCFKKISTDQLIIQNILCYNLIIKLLTSIKKGGEICMAKRKSTLDLRTKRSKTLRTAGKKKTTDKLSSSKVRTIDSTLTR